MRASWVILGASLFVSALGTAGICATADRCLPSGECEDKDKTCVLSDAGINCCLECKSNEDCGKPGKSKCVDNVCQACTEAHDCLHQVKTPVCASGLCIACNPRGINDCPLYGAMQYQCEQLEIEGEQMPVCRAPNGARCWKFSNSKEYDYAPCVMGTIVTTKLIGYDFKNTDASSYAWCRHDYADHERNRDRPLTLRCKPGECEEDSHCKKENTNRKRCNMHILACVECLSDHDCYGNPLFKSNGIGGDKRFCDLNDFQCKECRDDSDCMDPLASSCEKNVCKICETSADCRHIPERPNCASLKPGEAVDSSGCIAAYMPGARCYSTFDRCSDGMVCLPSRNGGGTRLFCQKCWSDEECRPVHPRGPFCIQESGTCAECDWKRPYLEGSCSGHQITTLEGSGLQACTEFGVCERCIGDEHCMPGYVCNIVKGRCQKCIIDEDCSYRLTGGHGLVCDQGDCVECLKDEDCKGRDSLSRCDVRLRECIPCLSDVDCRFHSDKPQCVPTGCIPCLTSDDCQALLGKTACDVNGENADVDTISSWKQNTCRHCVPKTPMTKVWASRQETDYVQGFIVAYNDGCDLGEVCYTYPHQADVEAQDRFVCRGCHTLNAPCEDPMLARCDMTRHVCVPCSYNADCAGKVLQVKELVEGVYLAKDVAANTCRRDVKNGNRCVQCASNADCPDRKACVNDRCEECSPEGTVSCGDNHFCVLSTAQQVGGLRNVVQRYECRGGALQDCVDENDCVNEASCETVKNLNTGDTSRKCLLKPQQACDAGSEQSECQEGLRCIDSKCRECGATADCLTAQRGYGACDANYICKPCSDTIGCSDSSGINYVCDNGVCGICNAENLQACASGFLTKCYNGACSECSEDDHCVMNMRKRFCRIAGPRQKSCVECLPSGGPGCATGEVCVDFLCVDLSDKQICHKNDDCGHLKQKYCLKHLSICTECTEDQHCRIQALQDDPGYNSLLNPKMHACTENGECKQCTKSKHCEFYESSHGSTYEVCRNNECATCDEEDDSLACPEYAPKCFQGKCQECLVTSDCPYQQACVSGQCRACRENAECGRGLICNLEKCVECTDMDNSQCVYYINKPYCFDLKCVECSSTAHCVKADKGACVNNRCDRCQEDDDCNILFGDQYRCKTVEEQKLCIGENTAAKDRKGDEGPSAVKLDASGNCPQGYFTCVGGVPGAETPCIVGVMVCDGIAHCAGGSDETEMACEQMGKTNGGVSLIVANGVLMLAILWNKL